MAHDQDRRGLRFWYELCDQECIQQNNPSSPSWQEFIEKVRHCRDDLVLLPLPVWEDAVSAGVVSGRPEYLSLVRSLAIGLAIRDLEERCDREEVTLIHLVRILDETDQAVSRLSEKIEDYYMALHPAELAGSDRTIRSLIDTLAKDASHPLSPISKNILRLVESRTVLSKSVREYSEKTLPNMSALCGPLVSARLLAHAGSKRHLACMPAATIQVLGAGPSLFTHLTSGTRPPKHGLLYQYKGVHHTRKRLRGRVSRVLACQLAIAARIDYYRGVRDERFIQTAGMKILRAGEKA